MDIKKYWHEWLIIGATIFVILWILKKLCNCFFSRTKKATYANQIDDLSIRSGPTSGRASAKKSDTYRSAGQRDQGSELWDFRSAGTYRTDK